MILLTRCGFLNAEVPIFYFGLDLAQSHDHTALCVLKRHRNPATYTVIGLKRFPLGTSYVEITDYVLKRIESPETQPNLLVVDATGVGAPIVDLLRKPDHRIVAVQIHGGDKVSEDRYYIRTPKRDLVANLQILFQTKRLRIASRLLESQMLVRELLVFQTKISEAGRDLYGSWREGTHDDLVLAVSLAAWAGERGIMPSGIRRPRPSTGRRQMYEPEETNESDGSELTEGG